MVQTGSWNFCRNLSWMQLLGQLKSGPDSSNMNQSPIMAQVSGATLTKMAFYLGHAVSPAPLWSNSARRFPCSSLRWPNWGWSVLYKLNPCLTFLRSPLWDRLWSCLNNLLLEHVKCNAKTKCFWLDLHVLILPVVWYHILESHWSRDKMWAGFLPKFNRLFSFWNNPAYFGNMPPPPTHQVMPEGLLACLA